jgi:hypothetical protein
MVHRIPVVKPVTVPEPFEKFRTPFWAKLQPKALVPLAMVRGKQLQPNAELVPGRAGYMKKKPFL